MLAPSFPRRYLSRRSQTLFFFAVKNKMIEKDSVMVGSNELYDHLLIYLHLSYVIFVSRASCEKNTYR